MGSPCLESDFTHVAVFFYRGEGGGREEGKDLKDPVVLVRVWWTMETRSMRFIIN